MGEEAGAIMYQHSTFPVATRVCCSQTSVVAHGPVDLAQQVLSETEDEEPLAASHRPLVPAMAKDVKVTKKKQVSAAR